MTKLLCQYFDAKIFFARIPGQGFALPGFPALRWPPFLRGHVIVKQTFPPCDGRWSSNHCRCNAVILPACCGGTACPCSCSLSCIDTRPSLSGGFHLPLLPWCWTAAIPTSWRTPPLPCSCCWVWQRSVLSTAAFLHLAFWPAFLPAAFAPVSGGIAARWLISRCRAE